MGQQIWTEAARVQLVEAVITVEKEMKMKEATSSGQKMDRPQKWKAIARLLPPELQSESRNSGKQSYNLPKCCSIFHNLAKGYRDKVAGKRDLRNLTDPVCRLFKKREELLNERGSLPGERRLRPGSAKRINKSNNLGLRAQPLLKDVAKSSDEQSLSSVPKGKDARFFKRIPNEVTQVDLVKGKDNTKAQWTETARLLVIEAVIQVEEEIRNGLCGTVRSSTGRPVGKWERIDALLPPSICPRGRVWNGARGTYSKFRCERFFDSLLARYRDHMGRKGRKGRKRRKGLEDHKNLMLTKPVCERLMKVLKARTSSRCQKSSQSAESPGRVIASANLFNEDTSRNPDANQVLDLSSNGESLGKGAGGSFFSDYTNRSESSSEGPHNDDNSMEDMELNHMTFKDSTKRLNADSSLGCPPRSFSQTHYHDNGNKSANTSLRSASRFEGEFKDPDDTCERSADPEVRTRAPCRTPERDVISPTKPPSESLRASSSVGNSTDSRIQVRDMVYGFDGPLKRLELEFYRLSSWVQSQSVPMCTQLLDERNNSAARAGKRRKFNFGGSSAEPFDDSIHESLSRCQDFQIRAAFQKVRVRFAEELKDTCAELSRQLQQGSELLSHSRTPSPDVSRKRS